MGNHIYHFNSKGQVKCWGYNKDGQLGLGDTNTRGSNPDQMGTNLPYVELGTGLIVDGMSIGSSHTCVHFTSNVVKCWGSGTSGKLGLGDEENRGDDPDEMGDNLATINLGTQSTPSKIVCGGTNTCVLFANKKVKCFGYNDIGQTGYEGVPYVGTLTTEMGDALDFVDLGTGVEVESIYTSSLSTHNCVILATSQLMKCWGNNNTGQLGYGDKNDRGQAAGTMGDKLPTIDLGSQSQVKTIAIGNGFTCALRTDEALFCWGVNSSGFLGTGSTSVVENMGSSLTPSPYDSGKSIKQIIAGITCTCVLFDDYLTVKCIGNNEYGELGQEDTVTRGNSLPTTIPNVPAINLGTGSLQISYLKNIEHTNCVVYVDDRVKCFGRGENGELGTGSIDNVGDGQGEMGSNLQFVDIFSTFAPTSAPTISPTDAPTTAPTVTPTTKPTTKPTSSPSFNPTAKPSSFPSTSCDGKRKKACNKLAFCKWRKVGDSKTCALYNCSKLNKKDCEKKEKGSM